MGKLGKRMFNYIIYCDYNIKLSENENVVLEI